VLDLKKLIERIAEAKLPTQFGFFKIIGFRSLVEPKDYVALVKGKVDGKKNVLVRMHSGCLTGDCFHSIRCDCHEQLIKSMKLIEKEGTGVLVYIQGEEGRGIGIMGKIKAYHLQDLGYDTVEANKKLGLPVDARTYEPGAQVLKELGLTTIKLLTNNPKKIKGIEKFGLKITKRIPIKTKPTKFNKKYLETKKNKMGHLLD